MSRQNKICTYQTCVTVIFIYARETTAETLETKSIIRTTENTTREQLEMQKMGESKKVLLGETCHQNEP